MKAGIEHGGKIMEQIKCDLLFCVRYKPLSSANDCESYFHVEDCPQWRFYQGEAQARSIAEQLNKEKQVDEHKIIGSNKIVKIMKEI